MIRPLLKRLAPLCLGGATMVLNACSAFSPTALQTPSPHIAQLWQEQQQFVHEHPQWTLQARITAHSEDDGWNGKLYWRQQRDGYQLRLTAPFGQGGLQLDGGLRHVVMRTSDGRSFEAPDAEALLSQHMGWELPLDNLRYWVRGVPAPGDDAPQLSLDDSGRISRLSQGDWQIDYPAYRKVKGKKLLPRKVFLENDDFSVRLVIDRWQLAHSNGD